MPRKINGTRRKKARKATYTVEIASWDWHYSVGLGRGIGEKMPIEQGGYLLIKGTPYGSKLEKTKDAELLIWPIMDLSWRKSGDPVPPDIGDMGIVDKVFTVYQTIPPDAFPQILTLLAADRIRFVRVEGTELIRGDGVVHRIAFETSLAEDEAIDPKPQA